MPPPDRPVGALSRPYNGAGNGSALERPEPRAYDAALTVKATSSATWSPTLTTNGTLRMLTPQSAKAMVALAAPVSRVAAARLSVTSDVTGRGRL